VLLDRLIRERHAVGCLRSAEQRKRRKVVVALAVACDARRRPGARLRRLFLFFLLVLDLLGLIVGGIGIGLAVRLREPDRGGIVLQRDHAVGAAEEKSEQQRWQQRNAGAQRVEEVVEVAERDEAAPLRRVFFVELVPGRLVHACFLALLLGLRLPAR